MHLKKKKKDAKLTPRARDKITEKLERKLIVQT